MGLRPSTWRTLGLAVGISYTFLGAFDITQPTLAAKLFNLHPEPITSITAEDGRSAVKHVAAHAESISTSMILLGARDLSIGVALLTFYNKQNAEAMGTLIMSGMILCAVDVVYIWRLRGWEWGCAFAAGAASWGVIGMGLLEYF